jgi:hypothetical protein
MRSLHDSPPEIRIEICIYNNESIIKMMMKQQVLLFIRRGTRSWYLASADVLSRWSFPHASECTCSQHVSCFARIWTHQTQSKVSIDRPHCFFQREILTTTDYKLYYVCSENNNSRHTDSHGDDTPRHQHIAPVDLTPSSASLEVLFEYSCSLHTSDIHAPSRALAVFSLSFCSLTASFRS